MSSRTAVGVLPCVVALAAASSIAAQTDWFDVSPAPTMWDSSLAFDPVNGGMLSLGTGHSLGTGSHTWRFRSGRWERLYPNTQPPVGAQASMVTDMIRSRIVVFGGQGFTFPNQYFDDKTWEWNGIDWRLLAPTTRPPARSSAAMAFDEARDEIVLFGGFAGVNGVFGDTWLWNGADWRSVNPTNQPTPRFGAAMAFDPVRGVTLMYGGNDNAGAVLDETWAWTGSNWLFLGAGPPARASAKMVFSGVRSTIVLFGGSTVWGRGQFADTWEWNGASWTQLPVTGPAGRDGHGFAFDPLRNVIVCHGGFVINEWASSDTWEWDGTRWTDLGTRSIPGLPILGAMAFDSHRRLALHFGGFAGHGRLDDFHAWDGARWREITATPRPPGRTRHAMAFDPRRSCIVLFGGEDNSGALDDTWEWDGAQWTQRSPLRSPSPRRGHRLVHDTHRDRTVLFGGDSTAETWEWDGVNWRLMMYGFPAARGEPGMAFDEKRGVTLMFGGHTGSAAIDDTWEWRGFRWRRLSPATVPPPRFRHVMVYDSLRERVVMHGGDDHTGYRYDDTWEWDGRDWLRVATPHRPEATEFTTACFDSARHRLVSFRQSDAQTWEYGALAIPSVSNFGHGCVGTAGVPRFATPPGARPWIGEQFPLVLTELPPSTAVFVAIGLSNTQWGTTPLPFDLTSLQMPGCSLLTSAELLLGTNSAGSTATLVIELPTAPTAANVSLYAQAFVLDRGANAAGVNSSDGLALRLGMR